MHFYALPMTSENKKGTAFTIASKTIKYLQINITKEVKNLCSENCNTLKKKKKKMNTHKQTGMCSMITGRIIIVKMVDSTIQGHL